MMMSYPIKLYFKTMLCGALLTAAFAQAQEAGAGGKKVNLLKNSSFEDGDKEWAFNAWGKRGKLSQDMIEKHEGKASICIDNPAADDSFLKQTIAVKPKTRYRLSGYIKTQDVVGKGAGATLSIEGGFEKTEVIAKSKSWTKVTLEFDTRALDSIKLGPRLGHYSSPVMGKAWFDELTLIELGPGKKK